MNAVLDIEAFQANYPPIHWCAYCGYQSMTKILLSYKFCLRLFSSSLICCTSHISLMDLYLIEQHPPCDVFLTKMHFYSSVFVCFMDEVS